MQIIAETTNFEIKEPTAVVLGKFDGVHIGHQYLVSALLEQKNRGLKTVVFTFDRSPASFFTQDRNGYRELCSTEEKRRIFDTLGVDILVEFPTKEETLAITAEEFITEMLQKRLNCNVLIAGEDVSFGYRGRGDREMLLAYAQTGAFEVQILDKLRYRDVFGGGSWEEEVSSTSIRKELATGNIAIANELMGRPFSISGEVIHGRHLGSTVFRIPTANIRWNDDKVIPAFGVYFTEILTENGCLKGITNVGKKPTVERSDDTEVLAESHLFDFSGDLYGQQITVCFYEFSRPEQKFADFEALKNQLQCDVKQAEVYWGLSERKYN